MAEAVSTQPLVAFAAFYQDDVKVFESAPFTVTEGLDARSKAVPIRFTVPLSAVEQIRRDDLIVVVGSVGEGASAIAVAERPDMRSAGPQPVIDEDKAVRVEFDARSFKPEVAGVWRPADGDQHMGADFFRLSRRAVDADRNIVASRHEREGGVFRVDLRTGMMSICYVLNDAVVCTPQAK